MSRRSLRSKKEESTKNMAASTASGDELCGICKVKITEDPTTYEENSIECECCIKWFHLKCVNLPEEKYKAITDFNLHWYCEHCDQGAVTLYQHCTALRADQLAMKNDILRLTERMKKCEQVDSTVNDKLKRYEQGVKAKVAEEVKQVESTLTSKLTGEIDSKIKSEANNLQHMTDAKITSETQKLKDEFNTRMNVVIEKVKEDLKEELAMAPPPQNSYADAATTRQIIREEIQVQTPTREVVRDEMYEREQIQLKKNNMMILNLKESLVRDDAESEDKRRINEIITSKLNLNITITNATRLGTFNREKARPIRVTLEHLDDKKRILSRAVKLRDLEEADEYAKVYIRPDLTKKQLEVSKNLYGELLRKREEYPEQRWKIIKGEIVELEPED